MDLSLAARTFPAVLCCTLLYIACCLNGVSGACGIVTLTFSGRDGFNIFVLGFVVKENVWLRQTALQFSALGNADDEEEGKNCHLHSKPALKKTLGAVMLNIEADSVTDSDNVPVLGEIGTG